MPGLSFLGSGIGLCVGWGGEPEPGIVGAGNRIELPGGVLTRGELISDWWGLLVGDCGIAGITKCDGPLGVDGDEM